MNTTFAKSETLLGVAFAPLDLVRQVGLVAQAEVDVLVLLRALGRLLGDAAAGEQHHAAQDGD